MWNRFKDLLRRNDLNEDEKSFAMPTLRALLVISVLASIGAIIVTVISGYGVLLPPLVILFAVIVACYFLLRMGILLPTQLLLPTSLLLALNYIITVGNGLHDIDVIAYSLVVVLASLTLGQRGSFAFAFLIIISIFAIGYGEMTGILVSPTSKLTEPISPFTISITVLAIAFIQRTLMSLLNKNVSLARTNEQKQREAVKELQELQSELENRVMQRTQELEVASRGNARRADQFKAITEVSRAMSSSTNLQKLLPEITNVISKQFDFYHVGIFLNDTSNRYAILSAANSEGGKVMLERGHKLKIGEQGIVGFVTGAGAPRVALDVGKDATYFNNPDLPETHSEMALPLKIAGSIVGALDVQSMNPNAFSNEDVEVLSALTDQVSLVIQNARLFEQAQKSPSESEALSRQYLRENWSRAPKELKLSGYRYTSSGTVPLEEVKSTERVDKRKAKPSDHHEVSVPIVLRGETIGTLAVQVPSQERIKADQMDLIKAVAERVALSAENARLFEDTTRRAERERLVSDITTKIRGTNNPEEMIKIAAQEIKNALGVSRVDVLPQKLSNESKS